MPVIQASDIPDIVVTTRKDEGNLLFQQIAQDLTHYEVFPRWFTKDKVTIDDGYAITRTLMNKVDRAAAQHVGFTEPDAVNIIDVLTQLSVQWVHAQTKWGLIYQTDVLMNSGRSLIQNIVKARRLSALLAMVEQIEEKAFGSAPALNDKRNPWALKYWLVYNGTDGHTGGAPSGHTTKGGVNVDDVPEFKNYSFTYSAVSQADTVKSMRTMFRKCRFESPISHPDLRGSIANRYRIYCNEQTIGEFEDVARSQKNDLGTDLAMLDGSVTISGYPIIYIPQLDDDSTYDPIYAVDHSTFYPVALKGDYLRETGPIQGASHNTWNNFVDLTYNFVDVDPRRSGVGAKTGYTG